MRLALAVLTAAALLRKPGFGPEDRVQATEVHSAQESLCIDGHLVPQLYLLGAMKCATTSLAMALVQRGILSAAGDDKKEFHWFDTNKEWNETVAQTQAKYDKNGTEIWAEQGEKCPERYAVSADFTPLNLMFSELPKTLHDYYGPQSDRLRFVVMLREPLGRLQSQFYHTVEKALQSEGDRKIVNHEKHLDKLEDRVPLSAFDEYVAAEVSAFEAGKKTEGGGLERSLYARHLAAYLDLGRTPGGFPPGHFVILPMRRFIAEPDEALQAVAASVAWPASRLDAAPHAQAAPEALAKRALSEDVTPATRARVGRVLDADRRQLAELLFAGHEKGMKLVGFAGGSARDVEAWLQEWW